MRELEGSLFICVDAQLPWQLDGLLPCEFSPYNGMSYIHNCGHSEAPVVPGDLDNDRK
jgi:hypothetical protein